MIEIREISETLSVGILDLMAFSGQEGLIIKREQEKKGTLFLLKNMLGTSDFKLDYHSTKKPFLEGRTEHISVSHSHDKLAIIINTKEPTGIDIELIRDKVIKIRHKFLTEKELAFVGSDTDKLITFWAAKEALYKAYGLKEVDFIKNLRVELLDDPYISGSIKLDSFKKSYRLVSEKIEDYRLVYILNEV